MKNLRIYAAILILIGVNFGLYACTVGQPQTTVAALEVALTAAESVAYQYGTLPSCAAPGAGVLCAQPALVQSLVRLDAAAFSAVKGAEAQAASGASPDLSAALAAVAAFQAVLVALPAKGV